jgi:hypothetical protein
MEHASFDDIAVRADWILSILPPSEATALSSKIYEARQTLVEKKKKEETKRLVYVDCNAVSPDTVKAIAKQWKDTSDVVVLDAGIIGGPPSSPDAPEDQKYDPTLYASAGPDGGEALKEFVELGKARNVKVVALEGEGAGIGDASALKMSYAVGHFDYLMSHSVLTDILYDRALLKASPGS